MDEPFAALDEMTRIKLNNDLLAIWREHRFSVVFVTQACTSSVYLSNRIVVMAARPGRVIDEIRIDEPYPRGEAFRTSAGYNAHLAASHPTDARRRRPITEQPIALPRGTTPRPTCAPESGAPRQRVARCPPSSRRGGRPAAAAWE